MAPRKFKKRNADRTKARPKITIPMHETKAHFEARHERRNIPDDLGLKTVVRGMGNVDSMLEGLNDTVSKLNKDRTLNEFGRAAEHVDYVDKVAPKIFSEIDKVASAIDKRTSEISAKINAPIQEEANSRDAREIRQWAANNFDNSMEVYKWTKQRIDAEDWESASSILGKKSYLTGLSEENKQDLLDYFRKKRFAREWKIKEELEKIGQAVLHKNAILDKYKSSISNESVRKDLKARKARQQATSE